MYSTPDDETIERGRWRLTQVYDFLDALNQLRNPAKRQISEQPWSRWLSEVPDHPTIRRGGWRDEGVANGPPADPNAEVGDDFVLQVDRPALTRAPTPPPELSTWLATGWENPDGRIEFRRTRNTTNARGETIQERFEDDSERVQVSRSWKARWEDWAAAERPARQANELFEELYELRGQVEREAERIELLIGDGILDWRHVSGLVRHPVILQRLRLDFESAIPRFTVREADQPAELYTQLLHSLNEVDGAAIQRLRDAMADDPFVSPLGDAATTAYLRRLVVEISSHGQGQYLDAPDPAGTSDFPRLWRDPVLFTRARNQGFGLALEGIREHLRSADKPPQPLLRIVGIETPPPDNANDAGPGSRGNEAADVLLTKPANGEQLQIARRLDKYGCVLVQGPPGTGKTHTIGNLIGHLLAQGKSILVTSHSVKALRVLRDQVVEPLRPLCVSVLEAGGENQAHLEGAIGDIVNRLQGPDADTLDREAEALRKERLAVLGSLEATRTRLRDARADEYREVVVGGQSWAPSEAAGIVAEGKLADGWIPPLVTGGEPLPLSVAEVDELYRSNLVVQPEDERELDVLLPESTCLLAPDQFRNVVETIREIERRALVGRPDLWIAAPATPETLKCVLERLVRAADSTGEIPRWRLAAAGAGFAGGVERAPWDDLLAMIRETYAICTEARTILFRHGPVLPSEGSPTDHLKILMEIIEHLGPEGKLGRLDLFLHPGWKRLIASARLGDGPPRQCEDFQILATQARVEIARATLVSRWERQVVPLGGPSARELGPAPERGCIQYASQIQAALDWWPESVRPLVDHLSNSGFHWDVFLAEMPPNHALNGELFRLCSAILVELPPIVEAKIDQLRLEAALAQVDALSRYLASLDGESTSATTRRLRDAVTRRDPDDYQAAFVRLRDLEFRRGVLVRRRELLGRLSLVAPGWAQQVQSRTPRHGEGSPPGDPIAAWRWRQLNDELERRATTSLDELLREISRLTEALARTTVELVDRRAWAAQRRRTSLEQQQALMGWRQTMARIGKGTGKRAPVLRAEARRLMKQARTAVPVWIMPLARVVETYDPRTTHFDVVIIDEASQSDVMALCALYLGTSVVVVGDHEQVSPLAIGQQADQIQRLIDAHLADIPNRHLYDGKMSVYDLAQTSFGGLVCLREHFRCVPEIIEFSNRLSYQDKIIPLRDGSVVRLKPHTIAHRVDRAVSDDKVNRREALEVASLVVAASEQTEYQGSTFGVASLLGDEQAREIDTLLRHHLDPIEYERRRIICGNAAQFQGDERDVMFLSLVDAPRVVPQPGPLPLRNEGHDGLFKKRYNVAASRARDQMWVVHSLNPSTDLQPTDLRRRLIEHAIDPAARLRELDRMRGHTESPFEWRVLERLVAAGYRVIPQRPVGSYRIDLVVEGSGKRLAVECDGDRYHTLDNLDNDLERQALLERLGWTFVRIRGSEFFRDPDRAMLPVFARLNELEIPPEGPGTTDGETPANELELRERVVRRAAELRREWEGSADEPGAPPSAPSFAGEPPGTPEASNPPDPPRPPPAAIQQPLFGPEPTRALPPDIPLPPDPILRAIAVNLGRDWRKCPVCSGRANLVHGSFGPYSDCFQPRRDEPRGGRSPVPTSTINSALSDLRARCPKCGSRLTVPAGELHPTVQCSSRTCRFSINWKSFAQRSDLISP